MIVRCDNLNYLEVRIRGREVLHFRPTLSTGKLQILQLPFCRKLGLDTFLDYNLPKIEDGNSRTKLIITDMFIFPHHYDEDAEFDHEEPDYGEMEHDEDPGF